MNAEILKGEWNELKGEAQKAWGKLTGNEIDMIKGETTRLEGLLQQKYGYTIEKAREEIAQFVDRYENLSLKGEWNMIKGEIIKTWGELTENEVEKINGSRTQLVGYLQQKYGHGKAKIAQKVDDFLNSIP